MRSLVTALNLVLPEGIDEPSDSAVVQMMENALSKKSLEEIYQEIREISKSFSTPILTAMQGPPSSLPRYSAWDAALTHKFLSEVQPEGSEEYRMLKQRGVRPMMMVHDEISFDLEITQEELERKRKEFLK